MYHLCFCKVTLLFSLFTLLFSHELQAQIELTDDEVSELAIQFSQNQRDSIGASIESRQPAPCDFEAYPSFKTIRFETFTLVQVTQPENSIAFQVFTARHRSVYAARGHLGTSFFEVKNDEDYVVFAKNACRENQVIAKFSTIQRRLSDPVELNAAEYRFVRRFQRAGDQSLMDMLNSDSRLSRFEKAVVYQEIIGNGNPFKNEYESLKVDFNNKELIVREKGHLGTCNCTTLRLTGERELTEFRNIRSDGNITGRLREDDGESDRIWAATIEWLKGPARYQGLLANANRCERDEETYTLSSEGQLIDDDDDRNPQGGPAFEAFIEWNRVCLNESGNRDDDCDCPKIVRWEWDYRSTLEVSARTKNGGGLFCGSGRSASATAMDKALVVFTRNAPDDEDPNAFNDPDNIRVLGSLLNAVSQGCERDWNGISTSVLVDFIFSSLRLNPEDAEALIDDNGMISSDNLENLYPQELANAITVIGEQIFDENWVRRSGSCGNAFADRARIVDRGAGRNRRYTATITANQPVRVSIVGSSFLQLTGQRFWTARAELWSSFRLASIVQGGESIEDEDDPTDDGEFIGCCTPNVYQWMYATVDDQNNAPTGEQYSDQTESFFGLFGVPNTNPWGQTGDGVRYGEIICRDNETQIIINGIEKSLTENYLVLSQVGSELIANIKSANASVDNYAVHLNIYNISGQNVYRHRYTTSGSTSIPIGNWTPGIYFVTIGSGRGQVETRKIVIK